MDRELEAACARAGWDVLYERRIDGLGSEGRNGERPARSPFPMSTDNGPSFNVNMRTGLWRDWHLQGKYGDAFKGGNIVQFDALMTAGYIDGHIQGLDYGAAERALRVELRLATDLVAGWPEAMTCRPTGTELRPRGPAASRGGSHQSCRSSV
jgi:hypothetical protein